MHITLVDDTIPFDGESPDREPLGGVEKAFTSLAGALAQHGHEVNVYNRALGEIEVEGAKWRTWEGTRPTGTDVLIAHRKPALLDFVVEAERRTLWVPGDGAYLEKPRNRAWLHRHEPGVVFPVRRAMEDWDNEDGLRVSLIAPGVRPVFRSGGALTPDDPPHAIATAHPSRGLPWLIDLWVEKIHPINAAAELHVYSAVLDKGARGEPIHESFAPTLAKAKAAAAKGVVIKRPRPDPGMVRAYRAARAHLYPGVRSELYCYTLAESQASGLPAVCRPRGGARECVVHDSTGYICDEDDAFANAALRVLGDQEIFDRLSLGARAMQRERDWDAVAADFEAFWA